jgi:hypothetical protein
MTSKIDEALESAHKELSRLNDMRDKEIREARCEIEARYRADIISATRKVNEAEQAKRDAIDAASSHPWDGKRVYCETPIYRGWSQKPQGVERLEGVVEVVRQSSEFPANMRWSRPSLGHVIVRKLNKSGKPSLQFHKLYGQLEKTWKLAD